MADKIAVVIVTYNRLDLLKGAIQAVKIQTEKADQIFVINNNSTDGTAEWLSGEADLQVIHQENVGGAGGFHRGIKEAYGAGFDWIWVMDDDVEPMPDCLEKLLSFRNISECIHPLRKYIGGELVDGELIWDLSRDNIMFLQNASYKNGKEFWVTNNACFEGMLVSRNLVEKIGFPDKRFFFVYDDLIYGFYASLYTSVIFVGSAVLIRKKKADAEKYSPLYIYYAVRNKHLIYEYFKKFLPHAGSKEILKKHKLMPLYYIKMILKLKGYAWAEKQKLIDAVYRGARDYKLKKTGR